MTEEDKGLLDGSFDGDTISIQTWEKACAESQAWADKARRRVAVVRRDRHRAYFVVALLVIVTLVALLIVSMA